MTIIFLQLLLMVFKRTCDNLDVTGSGAAGVCRLSHS